MNHGTISLRVGGKYLDRAGLPVEITEETAPQKGSPYRFRAHNSLRYTSDGRAFADRASALDIVQEVGVDPPVEPVDADLPAGSPDDPIRAKILAAFEDPTKWPMTDSERVALLRDLYAMAKGGVR